MATFQFSKTILNNLMKKPATVLYPVCKKEYYERARGHIAIDIDTCIFCGICNRKCPTNAIEVNKNARSWTINRLACIQCSSCVESCPKKCLKMENAYTSPVTDEAKDEYYARVSDNV